LNIHGEQMGYYYLEIIKGVQTGKRYLLPDGAVSIGRNAQNTVILENEKSVSGHHSIIYKSPERILFQDLQSTNGSFVNEQQITEKELIAHDVIGFGKSGPRLKLISSEVELPLSPEQSGQAQQQSIEIKKQSIHTALSSEASTYEEDQNSIFRAKKGLNEPSDSLNPSKTYEFEQKILNRNIRSEEMKELMNDDTRMEKILNRGNLGATQTNMLRTVHKAHKSMRRQWYYIVTGIVTVCLCVIAYFGIRSLQYQRIIEKAKILKSDIDAYDQKIASAKNKPTNNKAELEKLIKELDEKQKSLSSIKNQIDVSDFGKIYSDPLEQRIDEVLMRFGETDYHIPKEMKERVQHHIDIYSKSMKGTIARYIKRKEKYFPYIQKVFKEKNIPADLAYVSMLESGFNPMALSHAGARGLWQFMPHTGRRFGLTVNDQADERTDPEKATVAAAQYFKELIGMFGGKSAVMLCMAAYNAGEGRVMGALRKIEDPMKNRDFWYIYRMGYLAEETNEYIPRVISLIIISEYADEYGFGNAVATATNDNQLDNETDFIEVDYKVE
ncbi:MAG TPA: transglycosylase SLT domain-containing protein, partial [Chitinispirillaceae bacterium]|nr:transglycosylase SLT domain-containing protein [Chitinispirillaceae bacterium]